jgi:hypothetical protein
MNPAAMNSTAQRLCIWSGALFAALFFIGFGVIAGYIPPPDPARPAHAVAEFYRQNANEIRTGMVMSMFAVCFYVPFASAISVHMKRIEGSHTPLTYTQLGIGAVLPVAFIPTLYFFSVAAYRPERSDEAIQQLNDMGWLPFTGIIYTIFVQNLAIGIAVLSDKRAEPIFPRWYGYLALWCGVLYLPACLDIFFTGGPLAWNGVLSWWLSLVAFFAWVVVTLVVLLRATAKQQEQEHVQPLSGGAEAVAR